MPVSSHFACVAIKKAVDIFRKCLTHRGWGSILKSRVLWAGFVFPVLIDEAGAGWVELGSAGDCVRSGVQLRGCVVIPELRMAKTSAQIYAMCLRSAIHLRNSTDTSQKLI